MEIARTTPAITDQIEREYLASQQSAQDAVMHAINVGVLLREAKKLVGHGEFEDYIADNFNFSLRTAQAYMQMSKREGLIEEVKAQRVAPLTVREALRLIADESPKARKPRQIQADRVEVIPPTPAIQTTTPETPKLDPEPDADLPSMATAETESVAPDQPPSPAPDAPATVTSTASLAAGAGEAMTGQAATDAKAKRLRDLLKAEFRTWEEHERYTMAKIMRDVAEIVWPHRPVEIMKN